MNNSEYVAALFNKNFSLYKNKNIYLYGTSSSTRSIIEKCTDYNIRGLLDGVKKNEYIYGKYVYEINDILKKKPDVIIIIARKGATRIIFRRINKFCVENEIPLFDVYGNDLIKENKEKTIESEYFSVNFKQLKEEIDSHEVISFDIFDTLLMRKVLFPRDVFDIIARRKKPSFDFVTERINAEQELLQNCNPSLEQIYDKISKKNNNISTKELLDYELEIEDSLLVVRNDIVELFNYAVNNSKEVYIVSDMYLDKEKLKKLLEVRGIVGFKEIIVSCDYGISKVDGLFEILKKKIGEKSCIHIGDNEEADGYSPKQKGIDSFLIKNAYEMTEISTIRNIFNSVSSFNSRLKIGLLISCIFNSPFALENSNGKPCILSENEIGMFIAPIISDFVIWMNNQVAEDNCKNVLLAARDGFLIKKMVEKLSYPNKVSYYYFLVSRASSVAASIKNKEDILSLADIPYIGRIEEMMKNRYLLNDTEINDYDEKYVSLSDYINEHSNIIIQNSLKMRNNYLKYINKYKIDFSEKTAFFDFVSSGTTQLALESIIESKLHGYYFINVLDENPAKQKLNIKAMYGKGLTFEIKNNLYDKYIFLEGILTSDMPTVKYFDDSGEPVYFKEKREIQEINSILSIHNAILNFFEDYLKFFDFEEANIIPNVSDEILGYINKKQLNINSYLFKKSKLIDEFNGKSFESDSMLE